MKPGFSKGINVRTFFSASQLLLEPEATNPPPFASIRWLRMGVQGDEGAGVGLAAGGSCSLLTEGDRNTRLLLRSLSLINPGPCSFRLSTVCCRQRYLCSLSGAWGWSPRSSLPVGWRSPGLASRGLRKPSCVWWTCRSLRVLLPTHAHCPKGNALPGSQPPLSQVWVPIGLNQ